MSTYQPTFVVFPCRIWNLPNITLQLLKFYEKIFQYWNNGMDCFVNNDTLKEYAGMSSDSSISAAFQYFEKHGELQRSIKNGKRYIIQTTYVLIDNEQAVDNYSEYSSNNSQGLATAIPSPRCSEASPLATARYNTNNINTNNINKSMHATDVACSRSYGHLKSKIKINNRPTLLEQSKLTTLNTDISDYPNNHGEISKNPDKYLANEFENYYPKKEGMGLAKAYWKKHNLDSLGDIILADIRNRAANHSRWIESRYIPNPINYLIKKGWEQPIIPVLRKAIPSMSQYQASYVDRDTRSDDLKNLKRNPESAAFHMKALREKLPFLRQGANL